MNGFALVASCVAGVAPWRLGARFRLYTLAAAEISPLVLLFPAFFFDIRFSLPMVRCGREGGRE